MFLVVFIVNYAKTVMNHEINGPKLTLQKQCTVKESQLPNFKCEVTKKKL